MKAIVCTKYGPPEVLQLQEVDKPSPKNNEVRIKIYATSATASDCIVRGFNLPIWNPTGFLMGDGQSNANFKRLGLWFLENAKEDDRMITTMPSWMPIYTGLPIERFEHMVNISPQEAKDFPAFIQECRARKVTLIAWDSRLARSTNDRYYKLWGLDRIQMLAAPFTSQKTERIGPCQLIHTISEGSPLVAVWRISVEP